MLVDMQVALAVYPEVDQRMAGELLQHVIEEADAGRNRISACAVQIDGDDNRRFRRSPLNFCRAHERPYSADLPVRNVLRAV
jgi:hypothetical protein